MKATDWCHIHCKLRLVDGEVLCAEPNKPHGIATLLPLYGEEELKELKELDEKESLI
jgi:hypothetical protein